MLSAQNMMTLMTFSLFLQFVEISKYTSESGWLDGMASDLATLTLKLVSQTMHQVYDSLLLLTRCTMKMRFRPLLPTLHEQASVFE